MAAEGKKLVIHLYNAKIALTDALYPNQAARMIIEHEREQGKKKKRKNKSNQQNSERNMPGSESHRKDRIRNLSQPGSTEQQELDIAEFEICELGVAFTQYKEIIIWSHIFSPKEFFNELLERQFAKVIIKFIKVDLTNQATEKPSITLNRVSFLSITLKLICRHVNSND